MLNNKINTHNYILRLNSWLRKWSPLILSISVLLTLIPLFWYIRDSKETKKNEIISQNQKDLKNLNISVSHIQDYNNETQKEIIKNGEKNYVFKPIQFWNNYLVDSYFLNSISKNYSNDTLQIYSSVIIDMNGVNNINDQINNILSNASSDDKENFEEKKLNIATLREVWEKYQFKVCNKLAAVIINNYFQHQNILNEDDLLMVKYLCDTAICGNEIKNISGDCTKIFQQELDIKKFLD